MSELPASQYDVGPNAVTVQMNLIQNHMRLV